MLGDLYFFEENIMRELATVAKIEEVKPIEGADRIVAYRVRNWWVVDQKDRYKVGDLVIYYEIDSFLPAKDEFEFLRKSSYKKLADGTEGFRLRTVKLKGQISQGLITPVPSNYDHSVNEGDNWTDVLGITKYEPPIPASLSGEVKGLFPSFIPKTDEERIQNIKPKVLDSWRTLKCYVTEKVDGSSVTIYYNNGVFGVCSRNLELKENESNSYWEAVNKLGLKDKLSNFGKNIALQGELFGPGIQGNKYKRNNRSIAFFTIFDIDTQTRVPYNEFVSICNQLSIDTVPLVDGNFSIYNKTVDDLLVMAENESMLTPKVFREGIVVRDHGNTISFKAISNSWLIKYNED